MIGKLFGFGFFVFGLMGVIGVLDDAVLAGALDTINPFVQFGIVQPTLSHVLLDMAMFGLMTIIGLVLLTRGKKKK